ncbi:MAG: hypothetical protein IJO11_03925 [Alphaproteobacteria bacterium]|nr:hypothetical protein [Alphaproteobacteria bacterium]
MQFKKAYFRQIDVKQIPFFMFITLKALGCLGVLGFYLFLIFYLCRDMVSGKPFDLGFLELNIPVFIWIGYFALSAYYGFRLKEKHLLWATVFVSLEWVYAGLVWILFHFGLASLFSY